jgi:hypothetical protein
MKTYWSAIFPLLFLILSGCGSEEFGSTPQTESKQANPVQRFEQLSCSTYTLIKPKVDILYVVDNSTSTYYVANDIKNAIKNTVDSISKEFDYRVIGTPLLHVDSTPFNDYQVLTNSQDPLSSEAVSRKIISSSELNFFSNTVTDVPEAGLRRVVEFINANLNSGLFRQNAYLLVVLISNGRDHEVEYDPYGNGQTLQYTDIFNARKNSFDYIKSHFNSEQLRLFSVTTKPGCTKSGWLPSQKSYIQMSEELYTASGATDSNTSKDSYDLCGSGLSNIFTAVNNSIKQVVVPHSYRYWPLTFAKDTDTLNSFGEIEVFKVSNNSAPQKMATRTWSYYENTSGSPLPVRELPTVGEPRAGKHFVRFTDGNLITYPDCVQVRSVSRTEYFGYVVLPKEPQQNSIVLRINGQQIPQSSTNGWSYVGNRLNQNIKMAYPNAGDQYPAVYKSGFMIQLNGSRNYYKSGDNVEAHYLPAGI